MPDNLPPIQRRSNKRLIILLMCGVIFMFGFCYMLIPLYNLICKQEGINGKGANKATSIGPGMQVDKSRLINVDFTTTLHGSLQFNFVPLEHHISVHPGELKLVYFLAENRTGKEITVQAIPSITPIDGARFLKKTECFCFTQQYFFKNEKAEMPVYFFIEPSVPKSIKEITLSYTLFNADAYVKNQQHFTKGRIDL